MPSRAGTHDRPVIIVWLAGGLGNQMFQYAFGRAQSLATKRSLWLDLAFFRQRTERRYELKGFNIRARPLGPVGRLVIDRFTAPRYERLKRLFPISEYDEGAFDASLRPRSSFPAYFRGYWQSEECFRFAADQIRAEFSLRDPLSAEGEQLASMIAMGHSVSVHVRRGDLVTNPLYGQVHGVLGSPYYEAAAEFIVRRNEGTTFFVFSDDIDWARQTLRLPADTVYVDAALSPVEALSLMSRCRHHIIANSTFSWWAAWLNTSPTKIVVAPRQWYALDGEERAGLVPHAWNRL